MSGILQDVRHAVSALRKSPGFTTVAVLTLALGIGANTAIFSVIRAVLLKPPPYQDPDRLVLLGETAPDFAGYSGAISAPNYLDWAEQNTVFERIAAETGGDVTLSGGSTPAVYVFGRTVSASYFDVFGMRPALGRTFAPDEDQVDKARVVVLSHRLWVSHFGSDQAVIGKPIRLDGELHTVIGVMPAGTGVDLLDPELWRPRDLGHQGVRGRHDVNLAVAKLKRGVTLDQARAQMAAIADRLAQAYPASNKGWGVRVQPWPRPVGQDFARSLYLLVMAVGVVLLDVAFAEGVPTQGTPFLRAFQIADQPILERAKRPYAEFKVVSASYFRAMGLRILRGRPLAASDRQGTPFVVVVAETFARTHFRGIDPIGKRLLMRKDVRDPNLLNDVIWQVVGVVADEGVAPWNRTAEAMIYATREQSPSGDLALVVRSSVDSARLQESIRKAVFAVDHDQVLTNLQSLDQLKTAHVASDRLRSMLFGVFAAIAVALAAIGLYGVLAYETAQRTREIGIRAALGASAGSLVALVVREGMVMTSWGLLLGLCGSLVVSRLLTAFLFGIAPSDPRTIALVAGVLAAVALLACSIPARRAARVDSLVALRYE